LKTSSQNQVSYQTYCSFYMHDYWL
jgi:hypothetical protein